MEFQWSSLLLGTELNFFIYKWFRMYIRNFMRWFFIGRCRTIIYNTISHITEQQSTVFECKCKRNWVFPFLYNVQLHITQKQYTIRHTHTIYNTIRRKTLLLLLVWMWSNACFIFIFIFLFLFFYFITLTKKKIFYYDYIHNAWWSLVCFTCKYEMWSSLFPLSITMTMTIRFTSLSSQRAYLTRALVMSVISVLTCL